jgi:hypothetical protein
LSDLLQPGRNPPRHWLEYMSALGALVISLVSLWVAIETEVANQQMVAASSWPLVQGDSSNTDMEGHDIMRFELANNGVGPAKIRTFEVFWRGKPYRSSYALLTDCCGFEKYRRRMTASNIPDSARSKLIESTMSGRVLRAGEVVPYITFALGSDNPDVWHALNAARQQIRFRLCYCSVFDQCWINTNNSAGDDLDAVRVDKCPVPKVPYSE